MMFKVIVLLALFGIAAASPFKQCKKGKLPLNIDVTNCTATGCQFRRGDTNIMTLHFKSPKEVTDLKASIKAKVAGFFIPLPLGPFDVCADLAQNNQPCPIAANVEISHKFYFEIPNLAPAGTRTTLQLEIQDQTKTIITCVQVPVEVVN